jgi:hypothetical protein
MRTSQLLHVASALLCCSLHEPHLRGYFSGRQIIWQIPQSRACSVFSLWNEFFSGTFPLIPVCRCSRPRLQERAVIFSGLVVAFFSFWAFAPAIALRLFSSVSHTKVDYGVIDTFAITCSGCKIQITNNMNWAGLMFPSNVIM